MRSLRVSSKIRRRFGGPMARSNRNKLHFQALSTRVTLSGNSPYTRITPVRPFPSLEPVITSQRNFSSSSGKTVIEFNLADIGEGITECEVLQWFVSPGDKVNQFDKICEVQSDKATVEITSRYDGIVQTLAYGVGDMAIVHEPLITIEVADSDVPANYKGSSSSSDATPSSSSSSDSSDASSDSPTSESSDAPFNPAKTNAKIQTTPAVRRIAREHNLDLRQVVGTGPKGRILKEDVLRFMEGDSPSGTGAATAEPSSSLPFTPPAAQATAEDSTHVIGGLQRIMVQTMNAANSVPTFGYGDEIVMDELVKLRKDIQPIASEHGIKLSFLPFIIKATSLAIHHYPQLNAHVNADCTEVVHKGSHNIGLAMDTPRGLLVPNIKDVQNKTIFEIAAELTRLGQLGTEGKLGTEDLSGGTFTLSNIGAVGGTYCSPILVVPEVMIGALGKFQTVPRFNETMQVVPTTVMTVSWSADHRVVDGATAARFSNLWKSYLESPTSMLMVTR